MRRVVVSERRPPTRDCCIEVIYRNRHGEEVRFRRGPGRPGDSATFDLDELGWCEHCTSLMELSHGDRTICRQRVPSYNGGAPCPVHGYGPE